MSAGLHPVTGTLDQLVPLVRTWLEGDEPLWIRTSGSTGQAKDVVLSPAAVRASAIATHTRLGGPGQWLLAVPPTGVAGLQVLVRSLLTGIDPVTSFDDYSAERRYASLVPTQLHRLLVTGKTAPWASLDAVLVGGGAVRPSLVERAQDAGITVVRTYGMSETCGGCVYDGFPLDGVRMRIDDGQIMLAGDVLFDGYVDAPRESEWFATHDRGEITPEGELRVVGRIDDIVVSGGVNVPLPAVTAVLQDADGVADAIAVGIDDEEWGQRVVALVVPADAVCLEGLAADRLRDAIEDAGLPRQWGPRDVTLVDAIPMLPTGKPDRLRARRLAGG